MNNGILPNSSNSAVRFNPTTQSLIIGDADQGRSLHGQLNVAIGQGNSLSGVSDKNVVIGSGNSITPGFGIDNPANGDSYNNGNARNIVIGTGNTILGNRASGNDGGNIVIGTNIAVGSASSSAKNNSIFIGTNIVNSNATSAICIGQGTNSGSSTVAIGSNAGAGGAGSLALGASTAASGIGAIAIGQSGRAAINGQTSFSNGSSVTVNGCLSSIYQLANGSSSTAELELLAGTTGATRIKLPTFSVMAFRAMITGKVKANTALSKVWFIEGAIWQNVGASTTYLIGTPTVTSYGNSGTESWTATATADTTNGALKITVNSVNTSGVQWHARVDTAENLG